MLYMHRCIDVVRNLTTSITYDMSERLGENAGFEGKRIMQKTDLKFPGYSAFGINFKHKQSYF